MEHYRFRLMPANRRSSIDFKRLEEETRLFSTAAEHCNVGVGFQRDHKKIIIEEIEPQAITLTFSSLNPLRSASQALSAFSRELLKMDKETKLLQDCIYRHTLFVNQPLKNSISNISFSSISDTDLAKAIIDLLFSGSLYVQDVDKRRETIDELKRLLLPYMIDDAVISKSAELH